MDVRLAEKEDIDALMEMFGHSRSLMRKAGNVVQWTNGYPQRELILESIENSQQYVFMQNGEPVGTFWFLVGEDPYYTVIDNGQWLNDWPYGVIHRIASNGKAKGIAESCLRWCFSQHPNIRVDTHETNLAMRHVLEKSGFTECGIVYVADGTQRLAFQKAAG
jgi:hypothetical protein